MSEIDRRDSALSVLHRYRQGQAGLAEDALAEIKAIVAPEIVDLQSEVESKSEQIGKLYKVCNERDVLLNTVKGIAEYCSTDHGALSAISRLAAIRNTADRAVAAYQQSMVDK